ncbi:protein LTV1 homolog isoform X1 [Hemicordylus capensis]|uniref:protein LTV1 homolog isoform X1 n=1 Tax=Hemicordylus capensis TaxID=884348 RepID=UPI002302FAF9|nr:protein LTV1 homolog isoform X1 [Hemicordylus capensis]
MPHRRKKPFIEKKKAVTFHLVHRSQKDPLTADDTAPQRVLLPAQKGDDDKRREEQRKYGVFFDDDYDYLQHLKEASGLSELVPSGKPSQQGRIVVTTEGEVEEEIQTIPAPTINLPSSVFASEFEEDVGLLNKAAPVSGPRLDFDPDIVAGLDDDFDFDNPDNLLEDDFILKANKPGTIEQEKEACWESGDEDEWEDMEEENEKGEENEKDIRSDDEYDSEGPLSDDGEMKEFLFMQEETRSRFTEYSLTSSVMRRNEQLTLLDERFEKFFEQFDDDEIGALDNAELEGFIQSNSTRLQEVLNDYYNEKAKDCVKPDMVLNEKGEEVDKEEEETVTLLIEEPKEKWDCESILSTYSNLYNHPKLIEVPQKPKPIRVSKKTGIPLDVLPQRTLTAKQAECMQMINDSDLPRVSTQPRSKNESKEDRKARKQAVKEERKERRLEKKANKLAFKQEKTRQEKELLNLKQNIQGLKLS